MTVALLTPVPVVHLQSARGRSGAAVFGTRALDVFHKIDDLGVSELAVLLYASRSESPAVPLVSWTARYLGWQVAVGNGVPSRPWRSLRPESAAAEDREAGWWYAFYQVDELAELEHPIPIGSLRSAKDDRRLSDFFIPEGPILVHQ